MQTRLQRPPRQDSPRGQESSRCCSHVGLMVDASQVSWKVWPKVLVSHAWVSVFADLCCHALFANQIASVVPSKEVRLDTCFGVIPSTEVSCPAKQDKKTEPCLYRTEVQNYPQHVSCVGFRYSAHRHTWASTPVPMAGLSSHIETISGQTLHRESPSWETPQQQHRTLTKPTAHILFDAPLSAPGLPTFTPQRNVRLWKHLSDTNSQIREYLYTHTYIYIYVYVYNIYTLSTYRDAYCTRFLQASSLIALHGLVAKNYARVLDVHHLRPKDSR